MFHTVTPKPGSVHWVSTFALDTADLEGFPAGAILDAV
jgi:hypothetical protein